MATILFIFLILSNVLWTSCKLNDINDDVNLSRSYVYWPNATIPFYINPEHFDSEQSQSILSSLSLFTFKTCLQFKPVMVEPVNHHVLLIENPTGRRKCDISVDAHSFEEPHRITVGYECLQSPHIEMMMMRALGFPFEHNRASRDVFIDVQFENIEPGSMDLFTKDKKLPLELRSLPYDVNSVTHFGERDFSKNGHRTIIFKERNIKQNRVGLSATDLRKIEVVYVAECLKRDRQAKVDLCKQYPGPVRKKRDLLERTRSLRVNPDITPPPDKVSDVSDSIKQLGIIDELDRIIQDVYKLNALALDNARTKYCNDTKEILRSDGKSSAEGSKPDVLGIIQLISEYTRNIVNNAVANLTEFCETSQSVDKFFRSRCGWYDSSNGRCPQYFKSTKSGPVKFSTQHKPTYHQSTKHKGRAVVYNYDNFGMRSGPETNVTDSNNTTRSKRNVASVINTEVTDDVNVKSNATDTVNSHGANSKDVLRMATRVIYSQKGVNYAPVKRRFAKSNRIHKQDQATQESQRDLGRKRHETDWSDDNQTGKMTDTIQIAEREIDGNRVQRLKQRRIRKESRIPKTVRLSKENKEFYDERKWPDRIVRYVIKDDQRYDLEDMRSRLEEVGTILENSTCVRIQEITEDEADNVMDYLVLDTSPDYVTGRVGGRQIFGVLELFRGGQHRQHAAMMVMAMLGFYFEVSRHDRDKYIRVHNRHIRPDKLHHFEKIRADATLPLPYDYEGATHPAWQFWRKVGKKGISTVATYKDLDPDGEIMKSLGQNEQLLSKYDLMKINSVYGVRCFRSQRRMKIVQSFQ